MPSIAGVIVLVFMAVFFLSTCEVYYE